MADASAAACSSSMAGYASTSDSQYHDVFINHRGPDVKETFATPLYRSLTAKGLQVFLDKLEMQVGHNIDSQIEAAIRVASVHIAIFSPHYAESEWCLNELLWMVKTGKTILPVFYNVKPEHLRRTKWTGTEKDGPYAIALRKYEQEQRHGTETIQRWREALKDVANISGLELEAFNGDQNKLLDKLVQIVLQKFPKQLEVKISTGLKEKLEELERTVLSQPQGGRREGAKVVGIVGLGGVGKSTLAKYFFNCNTSNYKGSSFLSDVRENAARNNISSLQSQLIKDLKHPASDIKIESCEEGADKLKNNLSSCHALVILDDVDHVNQLDAFLPIKDVLNSNSLILVTTRDESVLTRSGILKSSIYHLTGLNRQYSQQLFCSHAFSQRAPLPGFQIVVDKFLKACKGLPLSLKVSGALLCGKNDIENDIDYWKECLDGVNKLPAYIENSLIRISYDSLNEEEKQIFLDIACFCIGEDRDKWIRIWGGSGWSGLVGFRNLESKCLVEVDSENRIRMHDHLRDMGRKIAYSSESMERRLWHPLNNLQEIQSSTEITQVRGIRMTNCNIQRSTADIQWSSPEVFRLKKLQLLEAGGNDVQRILEPVQPSNLIWLCWGDCHDTFLPTWVPMHHLRVLEVYSRTLKRLWTSESPVSRCTFLPTWVPMHHLRVLDVYSRPLKRLWKRLWTNESPAQAPLQLRELIISAPLVEFPKSIEQLKHLEKLVACLPHLTALPDDFYLPSLKYLKISSNELQTLWQSDFKTPRQLRELVIDAPLVEFPKSLGQLKHLEKLVAKSTNLTTLPKDFHFPSLKYLKIESYKMERLWQSDSRAPLHLRELIIEAPLVEFPKSLHQLKYLEKLVARNASIATLPENFDLPSLKYLHLRSKELQRLWQCESQVPLQLRVLILDAPNVAFPKSLSKLEHLERLEANGKHLTPDFVYLPSLKYLLLSRHEFKIIPGFGGVLRESEWNGIGEDAYVSLRKSRGSTCNLAHLRRISLDKYSLEVLPNFLWNLTNLQRLDLADCRGLKTLPDSLGNLKNLQRLDLIGCSGLKTLPDSLGNLKNLQRLDLNWCHGLKTLPYSLGNLTNLQRLDLDNCPYLKTLPDSLGNLTNLQRLDLHLCFSLEMLPDCLGTLTSLQHINLSMCGNLKRLPDSFVDLTNLQNLNLDYCDLLEKENLPDFLRNLPSLRHSEILKVFESDGPGESDDLESFEEDEFEEELMEISYIKYSEEDYKGDESEEDGEESEEGYNAQAEEARSVLPDLKKRKI